VLTIQSIGNVSTTLVLGSSTPGSITLNGLTSPVTLAPGQSVDQNLVLTPTTSAPLGVPLTTAITASIDTGNPPVAFTTIDLQVESIQAQSASAGAQAAAHLGRSDIAVTLSNLATAITNLAAHPNNPANKAAVIAYLDNLILEMNAPFLADFVAQFQALRGTIASSTAIDVPAALTQLGTVVSSLDTVLSSPVAFPFDLSLAPNTALPLPGQPVTFKVLLQNNSSATNTYNLSLGSLPAGITGSLNVSSITLAPGANTLAVSPGNPVVTLTESAASVIPAQFTLTASIQGLSG